LTTFEQPTYSDADRFNDGVDKRGGVVFSRRVGALDELETETEADDRVVTEQRHEQHEHAGHAALEAERRAFEEAVERQSDDEHERAHGVLRRVFVDTAIDVLVRVVCATSVVGMRHTAGVHCKLYLSTKKKEIVRV